MRHVALALVLSTSLACATQAQISLKDGARVRGRIARSDAEQIYVFTSSTAPEIVVPRADIADIDHPGNVEGTVGTVLATLGLAIGGGGVAVFVLGTQNPDFLEGLLTGLGGLVMCGIGGMGLGFGLPPMIIGWTHYAASKRNAEYTPEERSEAGGERAWMARARFAF